jgi:hypothetical protein
VKRRQFLGWIGAASAAVGMSSLIGWRRDDEAASSFDLPMNAIGREQRARMNGRACHDFRMMSEDRSLFIDRKMLDA